MPQTSRSEIARALLSAFKKNDRKVAEEILADNFTFTSPYDDRIDKSAFF